MPNVQFFERGPSKGALQSQLLGEGVGGAAGAYAGQQIKQSQLQQAFDRMKNGPQDYISQLGAIAPQLLTTPGGAQLLGELAPILQKGAQTRGTADIIQKKLAEATAKVEEGKDLSEPTAPTNIDDALIQAKQSQQPEQPENVPRGKERRFVSGQAPSSNEPFAPQRTVGPQIQRPMSPPELEKYKLDLMKNSADVGSPIDYNQASQIADKQNESIAQYNAQIQKENELKEQHIEKMSADVVARATNSNLIKSPAGIAVAEKLGYEARNAKTPEERWQYVKNGLEEYNTAIEGLERLGSPPGPIGSIYQKLMGTYRDREQLIDQTQPYLDKFRKLNLIPEAREALTVSMGLGPEDAERALFPFTKEEKKDLANFPINKNQSILFEKASFPGESFVLPEKDFAKFKDQISDYLTKNKDVNLISLRGYLNQDRRYAWQDYAKALSELQDEGRFIPDNIQFQQLPIVQQAPLPGLAQMFKYRLTGTR